MKKMMILASLVAIAFTSCTQTELNAPSEKSNDKQITFATIVGKASSRLVDGTSYPEEQPFKSKAYITSAKTFEISQATEYFDWATVSFSNSSWTTSPAQFWPLAGYLTFYSYSPDALLSIKIN